MKQLFTLSLLLLLFSSQNLLAQGNPDCAGAFTLCSNSTITFNPSGIGGIDDFASASNNAGCLSGGENNTAWYYFEMNASTPPGSTLEFSISPVPSADYDFAVFGPGVECGSLGSPIRCSWAAGSGPTGLSSSASDFSEGAGGDSFVAPLTVNAGEGYYLVVDNWSGNGAAFNMNFSGSAAPFLDCSATPCSIVLSYNPVYSVCGGDPAITLSGTVSGASASATYLWSEPSGGTVYMDNPTSPNPSLNFPPGINATFQYTLEVFDGTCTESTTITVTVNPVPTVTITGTTDLCQGTTGTLTATPGYSSYAWSPSGSGSSITINSPGLYTVTVTGAGGCQAIESYNVNPLPSPMPFITGPTELCAGSPGQLDAGPGYDTYTWDNSATGQVININQPGTYNVTVTLNGCPGVATYTVNPGQDLDVFITGDPFFCAGGSALLDAGPGFDNYSWNNGGVGQVVAVDQPGNYMVTVTDAFGCVGTGSFTVDQLPPFAPSVSGDFTVCTGTTATLLADAGYASYEWSTGENNFIITPNTPGTYFLTVTDDMGCTGVTSVDVTQDPDPIPNIIGSLEFCSGSSTFLSTDPIYSTYNWSSGSTDFTTEIFTAGAVILDVTDQEGCTGSAIVDIIESPAPIPTITGPSSLCSGTAGTLSASPGFVSYNWSNGDVGPNITVDQPGLYILTVTNSAGCEGIAQYDVTVSPPLVPQVEGSLTFCDGSNTTLSISGGAFATYQWSDGSTNATLIVDSPGPIGVTVTDSQGCSGSTIVDVIASNALTPSISGTPQLCEGSSIMLEASPGYDTYSWSDGTPTASIEVFIGGNYEVTVTDAVGCEGIASIFVIENPSPSPEIIGITSICQDSSTTLSTTITYPIYQWSGGTTNSSLQVNAPGSYSLTVTDDFGCVGESIVDITALPTPTPVVLGNNNICPGDNTMLSLSEQYTSYAWSNGDQNDNITVQDENTYGVTVTNSDGCSASTSFDLSFYALPQLPNDLSTAFCTGDTATLNAPSGFVSYEWADSTTNSSTIGFVAGNYAYTVTDNNGCSNSSFVTLQENTLPLFAIAGDTAFCNGSQVLINGPSAVAYDWSTGATDSEIIIDTAGSYALTITDNNGCQASDDITITQWDLPNASIEGILSFCTDGNTELSAPDNLIEYSWSTGDSSTQITVNEAGTYSLSVTDVNGCINTDSTIVTQVDELLPIVDGVLDFCTGSSTLLEVDNGYATYNWSDGSTDAQLSINTGGTYEITVTDINGCEGSASVEVIENSLPVVTISGDVQFCSGDTTQLVATPGYTNYIWQDGTLSPTLDISTPASYSVTVTDNNGCQNSTSISTESLPLPDPQINGDLNFCPGTSTALTTGTGYSNYQWSDGSNVPAITVDLVGNYGLTVTDNNGCIGSNEVTVSTFLVSPPSINGPNQICPDASYDLSVDPTYTAYTWSTNAIENSISISNADIYGVTVTDANGCLSSDSIDVAFFDVQAPEIIGELAFCEGSSTTIEATNGYLAYEWSTGNTSENITVSTGGTYSVTATDSNACVSSNTVQVSTLALPEVEIGGSTSFCTDGFTTLNAGNTYTSYIWSEGSTSASIQVNQAGNYGLTVTDDNGCIGSSDTEVTEAAELSPVISGPDAFCPGTSITLDAGVGYATYQWSDNTNLQTLEISQAGNYALTVSDEAGCSGSALVSINEYQAPTPTIIGETGFCEGSSTFLEVQGGNYTNYEWSTGDATANIEVEAPNDYFITITDQNGCIGQTSVTVESYPLPDFEINGTTGFCIGDSTVLAATAGYQLYEWSNTSITNTTTVHQAGNYSVTVTSDEGCTQQQAISVETFALPTPAILGETSFCAGESTQLSANMPFTSYQWADNASTLGVTETINVSQAGDYSLIVSNENGCVSSTNISIDELQLPTPSIVGDVGFCEGTSTILEVQGGNYSFYEWSTGENTTSIEVNTPNNYTIIVTDQNGCIGQTNMFVEAYLLPDFEISGITGFCLGDSTILTATAGYELYEWSNASNTNNTTIHQAGNYNVTVTSIEGCTQQQSIDIETFELPTPEILGITSFCVGGSTELSSNMPFSTYQWSNGATTPSITASTAGTYNLVVTDVNGCIGNTQIAITDDIVITPQITGPLNFCPGTTTSLDVGNNYVTYSWSNGQDVQSIEIGNSGIYSVTVVDEDGCIGEAAAEVISWDAPTPEIEGDTAFCADSQTTLNVEGGDFVDYSWSNGEASSVITTSIPGNYSVLVTDANNCQAVAEITLEAWPLPIFAIEGATAFCEDTFTILSPSSSFPIYEWSTGENSESIQVSTSEDIQLTATNEFGCSDVASISVAAIPLPIADAGDNTLINCYQPSVELGGSSTTGTGYTVQWQGPGINASNGSEAFPVVDVAGEYILTITDDTYGCISLPSMVIVEDFTDSPIAVLQVVDILDCTTSTVTIDGSGSSSGATVIYQWYDENLDPIISAQSSMLDVEEAALYYLQVLDTLSGCSDMDSTWVSENLEYPIAEAGTSSTLNCAILEVPLNGSNSQTGDQILYNWYSVEGNAINDASSIEASVSQPGWYYISVSDTLNGCNNIDSVLIIQNIQTPTSSIETPEIIDCINPSVALIGAASSAGPNFIYNWAFETIDNTISNEINTEVDQAGQYFLSITNLENMCVSSSSVLVQENSAAPSDASLLIENPTCFGDDDGAIFIQEVIGGTPPYIISMNEQAYTSQLQYQQLSAGNYNFVIQDAIGCEHELNISIEESNDLQVELGDDIEVSFGDAVNLIATVNVEEEEISQIGWSYIDSLDCQDCLDTYLTATTSAPYTISITDVNGCTSTDEVYVFVDRRKDIYMPTAFSPNGDGNNEIFYIQSGSDAVNIKSFQVFNRWGESVFEVYNAPTNDPLYGWNGTYRGEEYNSAVFTWFAEVEFLDGQTVLFKGDVLLMK